MQLYEIKWIVDGHLIHTSTTCQRDVTL